MKRTNFQRFIRFFTIPLLLWACNPEQIPEPLNQTEWISYAGKDGSFTDQWRADVMPAQDHHLFQFVFILKTFCTL